MKTAYITKALRNTLIPFGLLVGCAMTPPANALNSGHQEKSWFSPPKVDENKVFEQFSVGQAYLASLQTGDLVFFTRPRLTSKPLQTLFRHIERFANGTDGEHIGVILRHPDHDYPYVVERTWRGIQVTPFEDRVLHSSSEDVMVRTLHAPKSPEADRKALELIQEVLKQQESTRNPLLVPFDWLVTCGKMIVTGIKASWATREAPPVTRMNDRFEKEKEIARARAAALAGNAGGSGKDTPTAAGLLANEARSGGVLLRDDETVYSEQYLHGRNSAREFRDSGALPNAVNVLGELAYVTKLLSRTYSKLDQAEESLQKAMHQNSTENVSKSSSAPSTSSFGLGWLFGSSTSSPPDANSNNGESSPSVKQGNNNDHDCSAAMTLLSTRRKFLELRVNDLLRDVAWLAIAQSQHLPVVKAWSKSASLLTKQLNLNSAQVDNSDGATIPIEAVDMDKTRAHPTFPNAELVAYILQELNKVSSLQRLVGTAKAASSVSKEKDDAAGSTYSYPLPKGLTPSSVNAADELLRAVQSCSRNDQQCVQSKTTEWLQLNCRDRHTGRIKIDVLRSLTEVRRLPQSNEFEPHNFREREFVTLVRGELGQEQYVTQGYNLPPYVVIHDETNPARK